MRAALDSSVIFHLASQLYAFSAVSVSEMVSISEIHEVPDREPCMRGLINLRGSVLPVLDLRLRLGMPSAAEELEQLAHPLVASGYGKYIRIKHNNGYETAYTATTSATLAEAA